MKRIATVIRDKRGSVHVRYGHKKEDGGEVEVVEVLQARPDDDEATFRARVDRFVKERT
jgi:hypothetical protein